MFSQTFCSVGASLLQIAIDRRFRQALSFPKYIANLILNHSVLIWSIPYPSSIIVKDHLFKCILKREEKDKNDSVFFQIFIQYVNNN